MLTVKILIRLLEPFCTADEALTISEATNKRTPISTGGIMANSRSVLSGVIKTIIHEINCRECESHSLCKLFLVRYNPLSPPSLKKKKMMENFISDRSIFYGCSLARDDKSWSFNKEVSFENITSLSAVFAIHTSLFWEEPLRHAYLLEITTKVTTEDWIVLLFNWKRPRSSTSTIKIKEMFLSSLGVFSKPGISLSKETGYNWYVDVHIQLINIPMHGTWK